MSGYVVDGRVLPIVAQDIMVNDESDLATIIEDVPIGSIAYTAGFGRMWQLGIDGQWEEIE